MHLIYAIALGLLTVTSAFAAELVEHAPTGINGYVWNGRTPKYLRVQVKGHNVRQTPDFFSGKRDNIAYESTPNTLYAVTRVEPLRDGISVGVMDKGKEHFIFVPKGRQRDFQFCESEACLSDLTLALQFLSSQNITPSQLYACGVSLDDRGNPVMENAPRLVTDVPRPVPRPAAQLRALEARIPVAQRPVARATPVRPTGTYGPKLLTRPLWEGSRYGSRTWTNMLAESLRRHGRGLLNQRTLSDAARWCPNYNKPSFAAHREEFWIHLLNGVARQESQFNPTPAPFDEVLERNVSRGRIKPHQYSMGLFALSYGSAAQRPYRSACKFDWNRDRNKDVSDRSLTIHDPKLQMDCAVGILNHLVSQNGGLGGSASRGGARFWSTLRDSNPKTALVRASLRRFAPCGVK